ncbi:extended synaptotagmin-1 [Colius striatus]|uniref:extended synaptotagmin-1 n=1 Tax=Colius striatus TaxID=57412 RepID=UPI002B1D38D5|nr:extended synaptotagmin-1 [Colius striatus]
MERRGPALAALGALGRRLLWALPAYAAGLLGLGAGALLLALALYTGWRRRRRDRERGLRLAARLHSEEEAAVRGAAAASGVGAARGELPAWVSFPDVERAEWLNKVLAQAWPFFGRYMEKLLQENIAPAIRASNAHLQTFTFTKVDMGEKPLRVLGVRAHPGAHNKQILLDLNISYVGDVQIDVEVKKFFCKAGVKGMQLHGMLRIILEPLLGDVPIVGALTMFFIRRPTLDINWTGMTNLLDIPGLSSMSDTMIMDTISSYLVLPNRLLIPLVPDLQEAAQLRCPLPRQGFGAILLEELVGMELLGAQTPQAPSSNPPPHNRSDRPQCPPSPLLKSSLPLLNRLSQTPNALLDPFSTHPRGSTTPGRALGPREEAAHRDPHPS